MVGFLLSLLIVPGVIVVVLCIILLLFGVVVNESHQAIVSRFGRHVRVLTPGLNFMVPFIESVVCDHAVDTPVWLDPPPYQCETSDKVAVKIDTKVRYRVANLSSAYQQSAGGNIPGTVMGFVRTTLFEQVQALTKDEITRDTLLAGFMKAQTGEQYGMKIVDVRIEGIRFDDSLEAARRDTNVSTEQHRRDLADVQHKRKLEVDALTHEVALEQRRLEAARIAQEEQLAQLKHKADHQLGVLADAKAKGVIGEWMASQWISSVYQPLATTAPASFPVIPPTASLGDGTQLRMKLPSSRRRSGPS